MRIQRSAEHRIVPWANGFGVTADVFRWPTDADEWTWRLSIADVSDDVPFSVMPGIDRHIMVANGEGMALTIDSAPPHRMDRSTPPLSFAGESVTTCRLLDGPIADLNLMVRRGSVIGALRRVHLPAGNMYVFTPDDVAFVVLEGTVAAGDQELAVFDAVRLDASSGPIHPVTAARPAQVAVAAVATLA